MGLDENLTQVHPTLAGLVPDGVPLADILGLFQTVYHVNGKQLLRHRLGDTHPANLALPQLIELIKYIFAALKSRGVGDPADVLAHGVRLKAQEAAAKLETSAAIGNIAAPSKSAGPTPVELENSPTVTPDPSPQPPQTQTVAYEPTKVGEERQPDQPTTNTAPPTIANPEVTNSETTNVCGEIVIEGRRLLDEHRVAEMLGRHLRTLQRWRKTGRGPPHTNIGRKIYYDFNGLQEWIAPRKNSVMSTSDIGK